MPRQPLDIPRIGGQSRLAVDAELLVAVGSRRYDRTAASHRFGGRQAEAFMPARQQVQAGAAVVLGKLVVARKMMVCMPESFGKRRRIFHAEGKQFSLRIC